MSKQLQDAYIVAATRTPVGKAPRGAFRHTRPDSLLAHVLRSVLAQLPQIEPVRVEDVIVGCAMPEYEQGMNVARIGLLLAGMPNTVAGMTVNRFCSSGLNAVSIAADRIRTGEADIMIAAGTESMSMIPMLGRLAINADVFAKDENLGIAYGMGLTAEKIAASWKVSREEQDAFAVGGVPPEVMGVGPIAAIPKVLKSTGLSQDQIDWIELNEAFAAQSLAVMKELKLDPTKVNPLGGAIALGHPLGATGAVRTATIVHGLRRRKQKYGMVSMCIGTGMGAAGIFEAL